MPITYSRRQFQLFRLALGLYLAYFFAPLIPHAPMLFGDHSLFAETSRLYLPSLFALPISGAYLLAALSVAAVLFAFGFLPYLTALFLWYGFASFVNYIPSLMWPTEGTIGWLILLTLFIPQQRRWDRWAAAQETIILDRWLLIGAWLVWGFSYSVSGFNKLYSPSWVEGVALKYTLENSFSNANGLTQFFANLTPGLIKIMSWTFLYAELWCLPFLFHRYTRRGVWVILTAMHLGIFLLMNIWIVTVPMLLFHGFLFNPYAWTWLKRYRSLIGL